MGENMVRFFLIFLFLVGCQTQPVKFQPADKPIDYDKFVKEAEDISEGLQTMIHQTIKKVTDDYDTLKYNTAIAQLMTLLNAFRAQGSLTKADYRIWL